VDCFELGVLMVVSVVFVAAVFAVLVVLYLDLRELTRDLQQLA
jgi:hypothetical protein